MRKSLQLGVMALLVLAVLSVPSFVLAQGRGGPPGGFGGGGVLGLLQDENVKKELGLVDEQVAKLQALNEKMRAEMGTMFQGLRELPDEKRQAKFEELREKMTARAADMQKQVEAELLPMQVERLKQLNVQNQLRRSGTSDALTGDTLSKELGLTEEDKERVKKVAEAAETELRTKTEQLREEAKQKILSALSPAQQAKFKQLTGTPITFSPPQFGRGGPGGGPPGGGNTRGGTGGGGTQLQRPADGD